MASSFPRYQRRIIATLVLLSLLLVSISATFFIGYPQVRKLEDVSRNRHRSHVLADRLRHSSDDLTRMVRTYAATGKRFYRDQFYQVLAIRNGKEPRPRHYDRVYWDLILSVEDSAKFKATGDKRSLKGLIIDAGIEARELALLDQAEARSNALVLLEEQAMHAMEGRFKGPGGKYTVKGAPDRQMALKLLHGQAYHRAKKKIMEPIGQFMALVDERTRRQVENQVARVRLLIVVLLLQLLAAVSTVIYLLVAIKQQNRAHLATLSEEVRLKTAELAASAQELERSNRDLEQFAYVASHDLQEPLRMVTCYLQLLERRMAGKLDDDNVAYLEYAVDGARRMKALIDTLLAYSRAGDGEALLETFPCRRALDAAWDALKIAIEESGAEIEAGALPDVRWNEAQLIQVFQNLLSNAIKFRGEAPPRLEVTAGERDGLLSISVQDNGIGIAAEHQERIFKVFQRLHTSSEFKGTGIGLALCQRMVERRGGQIWVESAPGEGSTFTFTLPHS